MICANEEDISRNIKNIATMKFNLHCSLQYYPLVKKFSIPIKVRVLIFTLLRFPYRFETLCGSTPHRRKTKQNNKNKSTQTSNNKIPGTFTIEHWGAHCHSHIVPHPPNAKEGEMWEASFHYLERLIWITKGNLTWAPFLRFRNLVLL